MDTSSPQQPHNILKGGMNPIQIEINPEFHRGK